MGVPLVIIHFNKIGFSITIQLLGIPHDYGNPMCFTHGPVTSLNSRQVARHVFVWLKLEPGRGLWLCEEPWR